MNKIWKITKLDHCFLMIAIVVLVSAVTGVNAQTVTVLDRMRIGGYSEDITFVTKRSAGQQYYSDGRIRDLRRARSSARKSANAEII